MPVSSLSVLERSRGVTRMTPLRTDAARSISSRVTSRPSTLPHHCRLTDLLAPGERVSEVPGFVAVARRKELVRQRPLLLVREPCLYRQSRLVGESADEGANKQIYVQGRIGGPHVAAPRIPPLERLWRRGR